MSQMVAGARWAGPVLLGAAASAALVALFSRLETRWVGVCWVALVPWLWVLDRTRSWREASFAGGAFALTFTAAVFGWFPQGLHSYSQAPLALCLLPVLVLAPLLGVD